MSKKFRKLFVPEGYRHYWSKYPEGYTIIEALLNWVESVNQLTDNVNDWNIYLDDFVENFDEKLRPTVREMLDEMEQDGRLAEIINEEIFNQKADITYVDEELNKKADITYVDEELNKKVNLITEVVEYVLPDDFPSLQSALDHIQKQNTLRLRVRIIIKSGHKPLLRAVLRDCMMSNVILLAEDEEVEISDLHTNYHLFDIAHSYAFQLNCKINMGGKGRNGINLTAGSYMRINPGAGITHAGGDGLNCRSGSLAFAENSIFTHASQNSSSGAGITAWGGTVIANGADVSGSLYYGARVAHGGTMDFDSGKSHDVARHAIRASQQGRLTCRYADVRNAGVHGIYALNASQINATQATVVGTGSTGIFASGSSTIECSQATVEACGANGVSAIDGSIVNFYSGTVTDCEGAGVNAFNSSTVEARNVRVEGLQSYGIRAGEMSTVNAQACYIYGSTEHGVRASRASRINVNVGTVRTTRSEEAEGHGIYAQSGSEISCVSSTSWSNDGNDLHIDSGGRIHARGCRTHSNVGSGLPSEPVTADTNINNFNELTSMGYILD